MAFSIATGNRFSAFFEETEQQKPQKKAEPKPKAPANKADNKPSPAPKKKQQHQQPPQKSKPKSPEFGGPITDDGFTTVTDKKDRRKPKQPAPKKNTPSSRKRPYDRHVSGTGRGKEMKKKGQGKANWGGAVEAGVEDAKEKLNRPRTNKNKVRKPKRDQKPQQKKEEEEEAPREPTEEEKAAEEQRRKEEEEEKKKLTLDQYLKKQKSSQPKLKKNRTRRAGEGQDGAQPEGFKPIAKPSEEDDTVVKLADKKNAGHKAQSHKKKKEKRLDVNDFLKDAPSKPKGKPHGKQYHKPRGRKAPTPQAPPDLSDEQSFPSLG
eukprot:gb/GECH01011308.1/.p1 GENE.gb/GECH01011308.1/~~gb/GECH01011308.1/.p1  ORF type:complete len:320 (+),score=106.30 gb/GECH01011308.1/:1-960(+)